MEILILMSTRPTKKPSVLFVCVHNAGRSQMAAAFFNSMVDPEKARAISAGTQPGERVHGVRVPFPREVTTAGQCRETFIEMFRSPR